MASDEDLAADLLAAIVDQAIDVLNRINKADPTVLPKLMSVRVPCNGEVADDPTVQVKPRNMDADGEDDPQQFEVGLLGIINGIFGIVPNHKFGYIVATFEKDGTISNFGLTTAVFSQS